MYLVRVPLYSYFPSLCNQKNEISPQLTQKALPFRLKLSSGCSRASPAFYSVMHDPGRMIYSQYISLRGNIYLLLKASTPKTKARTRLSFLSVSKDPHHYLPLLSSTLLLPFLLSYFLPPPFTPLPMTIFFCYRCPYPFSLALSLSCFRSAYPPTQTITLPRHRHSFLHSK